MEEDHVPTMDKEGLSSKFGHWTALYAAYLFLAGWAYLRYYFAVFGVDTGWLDLGFNDTVVQGFSVLFGTGWFLSVIYLAIFLISLGLEVFSAIRSKILSGAVACALLLLFPVIFRVARNAGIEQSNKDRGNKTTLPTITFVAEKCSYRGKVVYVKSEALYVFNLVYLEQPEKSLVCRFDLKDTSLEVPQLWLLRAGDLSDVRIVHYQKEATP